MKWPPNYSSTHRTVPIVTDYSTGKYKFRVFFIPIDKSVLVSNVPLLWIAIIISPCMLMMNDSSSLEITKLIT